MFNFNRIYKPLEKVYFLFFPLNKIYRGGFYLMKNI